MRSIPAILSSLCKASTSRLLYDDRGQNTIAWSLKIRTVRVIVTHPDLAPRDLSSKHARIQRAYEAKQLDTESARGDPSVRSAGPACISPFAPPQARPEAIFLSPKSRIHRPHRRATAVRRVFRLRTQDAAHKDMPTDQGRGLRHRLVWVRHQRTCHRSID